MIQIKPHLILGAAVLAGLSGALQAQPTDNPVLTAFPANTAFNLKGITYGDYSWSDDINWATVYDVTTDLTSPPFTGLSNVTANDTPPNHPNADFDDITGDASDDIATVNAAIAQLSAAGGGVLYFPAGVYIFSDNLILQDGVVIRGANPVGITDARTKGYDPGTDFFFPRLTGIVDDTDVPVYGKRMDPSAVAASTIPGATGYAGYTLDADIQALAKLTKKVEIDQTHPAGLTASNYGIVNVDLYRAGIQFLQEERADGSVDRFSVLFGSDDKNRVEGTNVVVFGNRMNNAVDLEWIIINDPDFNSWQLWPNRVGPHIDVMVKANSIVANNRVNDMHYEFIVDGDPLSTNPADLLLVDSFGMAIGGDDNSGTTGDADTDYTNPANLYLNRSGNAIQTGGNPYTGQDNPNNSYVLFRHTQGLGVAVNRSSRTGYGGTGPSNPAGEPGLQRKGNTIRQNWVYVTNRVGYQVSGFGLEVRDNVRVDNSGDTNWLRPDGRDFQTNNSATYENRGFDVTGLAILVDGNDSTVFNRSITDSPQITVDGEAILIQQNDGQQIYDWTITNNNLNSYIGLFKVQFVRNVTIAGNTIVAGSGSNSGDIIFGDNIQVLANPNFFPGIIRGLTIVENNVDQKIIVTSGLLANDVRIANNTVGLAIEIPDYSNSLLTPTDLLNNDAYVNLSGNNVAETFTAWALNNTQEFPFDNIIDPAPVVEIVSPQPGEVLTTGNYNVEVTVTLDEAEGFNTLDTVTLYDGSQLGPNETIKDTSHRSNANVLAGATSLTASGPTEPLGSGTYTATWNITQDHLDFGLFVIEALMSEQTVLNGENEDPAIPRSFRDSTFALIGIEEGVAFVLPTLDIVIAAGTDPEITFDTVQSGTYQLQKRTSLTSGDWEDVTGAFVLGDGTPKTLSDPGSLPGDSTAFYQVILL